uniref:Uncharacterized protein n=1 Tax=Glossina palpalis gambiensis TaxID=67801 RepID=A0A1B0B9G8_9MUSC
MLVRPTIPDARHTATFAVALALALTVAVAVARQLVQCHLHFAWLRKNITTAHENVTLIIRNAFCHNYNFEYLDILAYLHLILKNDLFRFRVPQFTIDDDNDELNCRQKRRQQELYKLPLNDKVNILLDHQVIRTSKTQRTLLSRPGDRERVSNGTNRCHSVLPPGWQFLILTINVENAREPN